MSKRQQLSVDIHTYTSPPGLPLLYSFYSKPARSRHFSCNRSGWVHNSPRGLSHTTDPNKATQVLCYIEKHRDGYILVPSNKLSLSLNKSNPVSANKPYQLATGNEVQLGRVSLLVHKIHGFPWDVRGAHASNVYMLGLESFNLAFCKYLQPVHGQICRICLEETEGGLVNPCHCCGSVGAIHIWCLQSWLDRQLTIKKQAKVTSITWHNFRCELCGEQYPDKLFVDGQLHYLLRIPEFSGKYAVLEAKDLVQGDKVVYVVSCDQQISLGSDPSSDIRLNDASVSPQHAMVRWNAAGPYLEDCRSEFGTSVVLEQPLFFGPNESLTLQSGSTLLDVKVKRQRALVSLFTCSNS